MSNICRFTVHIQSWECIKIVLLNLNKYYRYIIVLLKVTLAFQLSLSYEEKDSFDT